MRDSPNINRFHHIGKITQENKYDNNLKIRDILICKSASGSLPSRSGNHITGVYILQNTKMVLGGGVAAGEKVKTEGVGEKNKRKGEGKRRNFLNGLNRIFKG